MKCELCSSGKRLPRRKLCESCAEAITRLWTITAQNEGAIGSMGAPICETSVNSIAAAANPTEARM